ncbi:hypothetical protein RT97_07530 [Variovorax paradoxus]|uniref:Uncharacterized protein n=1 Tax=Variovorax paradoxus TaxID=34073 RepID=A0A0D0MZV2_VARPD|nr:hypothetical protein [Variovorax paradoxus]KIQ34620.1 hypothetical protein RT97_07530 [Variovorax paradoxus]
MSISPALIRQLVETELSRIPDARVQTHIRSLLVEPVEIMREWDYGTPGEAYPCWTVLNHEASNTGIAYCESGFGPQAPWGLVVLSGANDMSIGMDSGWFFSLAEAYFESSAATDLSIWRVFRQKGEETYPGTALTPESDWASTWEEIYRLRAADPAARYHCGHSVIHR